MGHRGRPTKPRTSEVGIYIEQLRLDWGWSVQDLAREAKVSYRTLSKLELDRNLPRRPEIFLMKVANIFGVHPNKLLVRASLTPMLRPPVGESASLPTKTISLTLMVTEDESRQLDNYLQYLRYIGLVESLRRRAEEEIGSSATEDLT